jgi:hypothetical protein
MDPKCLNHVKKSLKNHWRSYPLDGFKKNNLSIQRDYFPKIQELIYQEFKDQLF